MASQIRFGPDDTTPDEDRQAKVTKDVGAVEVDDREGRGETKPDEFDATAAGDDSGEVL